MAKDLSNPSSATPRTYIVPVGALSSQSKLSLVVLGDDVYGVHPLLGDSTIGRSREAEIRIDHPSLSRRHAIVRCGPPMTIEDLGSSNGTKVREQRIDPNTPVPIQPGQSIELGDILIVLQKSVSVTQRRRIWAHGSFAARVDEECARANTARGDLAVLRVKCRGIEAEVIERSLFAALGPTDVVGYYAPNEYEALLVDASAADTDIVAERVENGLREAGAKLDIGLARHPSDGQSAGALLAVAGDRLRPLPSSGATAESPFIGETMRPLKRMVERVAAANISVLIMGETGAGKEVIAETIHAWSPRADQQFVTLNCAALTETLLESELFGHERGAFTGAVKAKRGLLESADGGTVFLDEVAELPLSTQVKLLRVLEDRKVQRVGSVHPTPIDVRFISATNRDVDREVANGSFREDLFFRLNGISLVIPPLRERTDEIEPLVHLFAERFSASLGHEVPVDFSDDAMKALIDYAWPGNVRELRNVIERAVVLAGDGPAELEHLSLVDLGRRRKSDEPTSEGSSSPADAGPRSDHESLADAMSEEIQEIERKYVRLALAESDGTQGGAAKLLEMSRRKFIYRLEQLGIERPRKRPQGDEGSKKPDP